MDSRCSYQVRDVKFLGSTRRVLMQSANGPCPLLAACNVLLLRNQLELHRGARFVDFEDLIGRLTNRMLDSNVSATGGRGANIQENMHACLDVLPTLNVGMDVNCRFSGPKEFEATRELAVFDLLDITLVHGWVASPENTKVYKAVGELSYNTAVERVIEGEGREDGLTIREFLDESASQLTYEGIVQLHSELRERELAVLYRNQHFSTLLKCEGALYLLCTDVGFVGQDAVWERLDSVDGDTAYVDEGFRPLGQSRSRPMAQPLVRPAVVPRAVAVPRATCPGCGCVNEFPGARTPTVECGGCGRRFPLAGGAPAQPHRGTRVIAKTCQSCGALNQFRVPASGGPRPHLQCGVCGTLQAN